MTTSLKGLHTHSPVGGIPTPLKNMTSSVGMMKFPIYWEKKHQPARFFLYVFLFFLSLVHSFIGSWTQSFMHWFFDVISLASQKNVHLLMHRANSIFHCFRISQTLLQAIDFLYSPFFFSKLPPWHRQALRSLNQHKSTMKLHCSWWHFVKSGFFMVKSAFWILNLPSGKRLHN